MTHQEYKKLLASIQSSEAHPSVKAEAIRKLEAEYKRAVKSCLVVCSDFED